MGPRIRKSRKPDDRTGKKRKRGESKIEMG